MSVLSLVSYFWEKFGSSVEIKSTDPIVSNEFLGDAPPISGPLYPVYDAQKNSYDFVESDQAQTIFSLQRIVTILTVASVLSVVFYFTIKLTMCYMGAKSFSVTATFPITERPLRVGETITTKLIFAETHGNGQESACTPSQMSKIDTNLVLEFFHADSKKDVAVLKCQTSDKNSFFLKFSVRKAGQYKLSYKYGYFPFEGSPMFFDVKPGLICHQKTSLEAHNPTIICNTVDTLQFINLMTRDRYGNICTVEDSDVQLFQLTIKLGESPVDSTEVKHEFYREGGTLRLKLLTKKCNFYKCVLTYNGHSLQYGTFLLNCMSASESESIKVGLQSFFSSIPGSSKASLLAVGTNKKSSPSSIWISVNSIQISMSSLAFGIIYYPFMAFSINRRTTINYNGLYEIDPNENDNTVSLKISDGIQDSATVALNASDARVLMASFAHFQGQKLTQASFREKKKTFEHELGGFLSSFHFKRGYEIITIDPNDLLNSSIRNTPGGQREWSKDFVISVSSVRNANNIAKVYSTEKWLSIMVQKLFENPHLENGSGLFMKNTASQLLLPKIGSKRQTKDFEFAGAILAKCLHEAVVKHACINLTHVRFAKSFLAQLIGIPITYKHFETDDPTFNEKFVRPLLLFDDNETSLKFEDPESEGSNNINLIPNGNNIPVTKRNKEYFLNLLANERFRNRCKQEVNAFRQGFYKVIPQGLITDFDENELEKLLCGGGKSFEIEDLKRNSRIVGDLLDNLGMTQTEIPGSNFPESEQQKILRWFWTVISNLSDEERELLLKMTTGSFVLPSCGCKDLNPKFTIALIGGKNEPPTGHPNLNQICIGNHTSFEKFEKNLINSLYDQPGDSPCDKHSCVYEDDHFEHLNTQVEAETETETTDFQDDRMIWMNWFPAIPGINHIYNRNCNIL